MFKRARGELMVARLNVIHFVVRDDGDGRLFFVFFFFFFGIPTFSYPSLPPDVANAYIRIERKE